MATRTVSVKHEAYERLRTARRYPGESFSEVILRARWPEDTITAGGLLASYAADRPRLADEELDLLEALKARDVPPEDKWAGR